MRFSFTGKSAGLKTSVLFLIVALLSLTQLVQAGDEDAELDRVRVTVGDTTGTAGEQNSAVTVFLTNPSDEIFAFSLHLALDRNDIANFQNSFEVIEEHTYWLCLTWDGSVCTDSVAVDDPLTEPWDIEHVEYVDAWVGNFDTVGTLISGWDQVESRAVSTGELGLDMLLTAISNTDDIPGYVPPLQPQQGGVLFRMLADIFPIPPDLEDRTANVAVDVSVKRWFNFSTPAGESIGWTTIQVADTNYYMCTLPEPPPGTGCYQWTKVYPWECPPEGCDSTNIELVDVAVIDDSQVSLFDGKITVLTSCCSGRVGDANGEGGDEPTIGDVGVIIDCLFISNNWSQIDCLEEADVNQTGGSSPTTTDVTIGDVSILIDYLFITGPTLGLNDCL